MSPGSQDAGEARNSVGWPGCPRWHRVGHPRVRATGDWPYRPKIAFAHRLDRPNLGPYVVGEACLISRIGVDRASLKRSWLHGSHIFPHRVAGPSSTGISRRRGGAWPTTTFPIHLLTLQASIDLSEPQRCHPADVGSAIASIHVDVVLAGIINAFQRSNAPSCAARARWRARVRPA